MKICPKYTFGVGDRFANGAHAQLAAFIEAKKLGIDLVPVWNKSNREHNIIGSEPLQTRQAADRAVADLGWTGEYLLDADHINLTTVDRFVGPCDFFTLDVADDIGEAADPADVAAFIAKHPELIGTVTIAGIAEPFEISRADVEKTANHFLKATQKAAAI
jgi:tagaturonate epimerase